MASCSPAFYSRCHSILKRRALFFALMVFVATMMNAAIAVSPAAGQSLSADEARAIAREAYIYGFPLVDNYRIQYSYFVDRANPEYKASWNTLVNNAIIRWGTEEQKKKHLSRQSADTVGAYALSEAGSIRRLPAQGRLDTVDEFPEGHQVGRPAGVRHHQQQGPRGVPTPGTEPELDGRRRHDDARGVHVPLIGGGPQAGGGQLGHHQVRGLSDGRHPTPGIRYRPRRNHWSRSGSDGAA